MSWFKESEKNDFIKKIKNILKNHPFSKIISDYYHVSSDEIDNNLQIEICDLKGKFAEGNGKLIRIDKSLLNKDFFKNNFHFVIHEFFHWLKRRSENKFYFNDPEEVQSFVLQMAWELIQGKSKEEVSRKIHMIIQKHFKNKDKLEIVFKDMVEKAVDLSNIYEEF